MEAGYCAVQFDGCFKIRNCISVTVKHKYGKNFDNQGVHVD